MSLRLRPPPATTARREGTSTLARWPRPRPPAPTVDHALVRELKAREDARFAADHPRSAALRDRGLDLMPNGLRWHIHHLGPRAGYTFRVEPVRNADDARACADDLLTRLIRIWLANRGVWEAIVGAGPVVSVPATAEDVDAYLSAWDELLMELMR